MNKRAVVLLACLLFLVMVRNAHACAYERMQPEVALKAAEKAFIGTVVEVQENRTLLKVTRALKNVSEGDIVEAPYEGSSCDIRFTKGQRWYYLGSTHPTGSWMLTDEKGNAVGENEKNVNALLAKAFPPQDRHALGGTIERSCAPWDGEAHMITLENGVFGHIYAPMPQMKDKEEVSFPADGKQERGHGNIVVCPKLKEGETSNIPCKAAMGTIYIGAMDDKEVSGRIEIEGGETHLFKVKVIHKQVFCG